VHQNQEFAIRAEAQPPLEILRSATLVNAEILGRRGELGVVAPGALADLLLVDGDPLADVRILAEPAKCLALVMQGGVVVRGGLD
jgi:imidazolonepropionase-like amidohydrolase